MPYPAALKVDGVVISDLEKNKKAVFRLHRPNPRGKTLSPLWSADWPVEVISITPQGIAGVYTVQVKSLVALQPSDRHTIGEGHVYSLICGPQGAALRVEH